MLNSQLSMTTLSIFAQPAGSNSRRASEMNVDARLEPRPRGVMISHDVVPPTAMSAPRTTSSIVSFAHHRNAELFRSISGERVAGLAAGARCSGFPRTVHGQQAAQRVGPHGADADQAQHLGCVGPTHLQRDHRGCGAADRIAPVLVDDRERRRRCADRTATM